jgi:ubiquinone/menaquinone biosynthesis C-methylase UbiE
MSYQPEHDLRLPATLDQTARQDFVAALRGFVLHDMAQDMRTVYDREVAPRLARELGREPRDGSEVHRAMRNSDYFRFYSSVRVNAQEMTWDSVRDQLDGSRNTLDTRVRGALGSGPGSLTLDPDLDVPRSVSGIDVHLLPGGYDRESGDGDAAQGAFFDHGAAVFYMGLMGRDQGDIGRTMSRFVRGRYPDLEVRRILDLGCTVGHNTLPWAETYPDAEVHAIDVAAPCLRYALARARTLSRGVHFHQMDATDLKFDDESFDIVWSSMFFHEVPLKGIRKALREAYRVLRKGGLMLHMELPPNKALKAYDAFYLDWDSWYNNEPFYKTFRDQDPVELCAEAGFDRSRIEQHVVPSLNWFGEDALQHAIERARGIDSNTGRFDQGISWYSFAAWK